MNHRQFPSIQRGLRSRPWTRLSLCALAWVILPMAAVHAANPPIVVSVTGEWSNFHIGATDDVIVQNGQNGVFLALYNHGLGAEAKCHNLTLGSNGNGSGLLFITNTGQVLICSGTLTIADGNASGTLGFQRGGTVKCGSIAVGTGSGTASIPNTNGHTTGQIEITDTGTLPNLPYVHLIINAPGKVVTAAGPISVSQGLTIKDGTLALNNQTVTAGYLAGGTMGVIDFGTGNTNTMTVGSANINGEFQGSIIGVSPGASLIKQGAGTLVLSGTVANTFTGTTVVNLGTVQLNKTGTAAIAGTLAVGNGTGAPGATVVSLLASDQFASTSAVTIDSDGLLDLRGATQSSDSISLNFEGGRKREFDAPYDGSYQNVPTIVTPSLMASNETAGVVPKTNWNNAITNNSANNAGAIMPLFDSNGSPTGATATFSANFTDTGFNGDAAGNNRMMKGFLNSDNGTAATITVSGLPASISSAYTVYVYCNNNGSGGGAIVADYTIGATTKRVTTQAGFNGTFTESTGNSALGNYLKLPGNGASFTLTAATVANGNTINAIQIIADNPPAAPAPTAITSTIASLSGSGAVNLGIGTLTVGGATDSTFGGVITSTGPTGGDLLKQGSSALILNGVNIYTGTTTVNAGTLGGIGAVSAITDSGSVAPGDPASNSGKGILTATSADLTAGTGGNLTIQISDYTTAGADYDQLVLSGALTLGANSTLTLDLTGLNGPGTAKGVVLYGSHAGTFPIANINFINNTHNLVPTVVYNATSLDIGLAGVPTQIVVETQADGQGTVVPAQNVGIGDSITVYAIARDASGFFVGNYVATWSLMNTMLGVTGIDLVPSPDTKSAVFTAHAVGSANIQADAVNPTTLAALDPVDSGTITVVPPVTQVIVETKADGMGTVVPDQDLQSGGTLTVFAITRTATGQFVTNVAASWLFSSVTDGVVQSDLVASSNGKSAVFTGRLVGSAIIRATVAHTPPLTSVDSGIITVKVGPAAKIQVETLASGSGSVVPALSLASGSAITVFAISRDAAGNFIDNVAASWSLATASGGVADSDLAPAFGASATFTGKLVGTATIRAVSGALTPVDSGLITVTPGPADMVRVETEANGGGTVVPGQTLVTGNSLTVFAITRDAAGNFAGNVAASWSLSAVTNGVMQTDLVPDPGDSKSAVLNGHSPGSAKIHADFGGLPSVDSGTIIVTAGPVTQISVETAADGAGSFVQAQSIFSGESITVYAITRDSFGNFVDNVAPDLWILNNLQDGVTFSDLSVSSDGKSAVFTGHDAGSAYIHVELGNLSVVDSGTITVIVSSKIRIETAPDSSGGVVPPTTLTSGQTLTVYANLRDSMDVFQQNVALDSWALQNFMGGVLPGDLVVAGDNMSATFVAARTGSATIHGTSSAYPVFDSGVITVIAGSPSRVQVETAADGSGSVVAAQNVASGNSITVFAVSHDAAGNVVGNAAASWSLSGATGGVTGTDLAPNPNGLSAVFTGHQTGSAVIHAASGTLTAGDSGIITVVASGTPVVVQVETKDDGTGTVVPNENLAPGGSLTVFAITRDASGNFVANVAADGTGWQLVNQSGAADSTLTPSGDFKSAVFRAGNSAGSAHIRTASGMLPATDSGTISVVTTATQVRVETQADGNGSVLGDTTLIAGQSLTVFAIARDILDNFVANISANWSLQAVSGGVLPRDLTPSQDGMSAVFTAHGAGTARIQADSNGLAAVDSGVITVTPGAATQVSIETAANGSGSVLPATALQSGNSITVFAISRDAGGNFVNNVTATWSMQNTSGGVAGSDLSVSSGTSVVFTGHVIGSGTIHATVSGLMPGDSGIITVTPGTPTQVRVETLADGSGTVVPTRNLSSGSTLTVFAVARDASGNFTGNVAASWSLASVSGGVVQSDLAPPSGASAVFTGRASGSAMIQAVAGSFTGASGTITVTPGAPAQVRVETAANGSGSVVQAQDVSSGTSLVVFAIVRDASGNFVANAAADTWALTGITGGVVPGDLVPNPTDGKSAVFTGHVVGSAVIHATSAGLATTDSGTLTVIPGAVTQVRVETAATGSGTVVPAQTLLSGATLTVYAITRDASANFVDNAAASWSLVSITGGVVQSDLAPPSGASAVFTAHASGSAQIQAIVGAFTGATGTIAVNSPPMINSPPIATPSSAGVGQTVTFTVAASDTDPNDTLAYTWDFHDGSPTADGASVTHVFTTPGAHIATVTVTDSHGAMAASNVTVTVNVALYVTGNPDDDGTDVDGDGFSDKLETAVAASLAGAADPAVTTKTPFDKNGIATAPLALSIKSLSIKLNFHAPLKDTIQLKGSLPLAASAIPLTGHKVVVDVGGFIAAYTLDVKGKSPKSKTSSFTIGAKPNKKTGLSNFTFKVLKSTVALFFADDGMTVSAAAKTSVNIPVTVLFSDTGFRTIKALHYTQTKGTTGKTTP